MPRPTSKYKARPTIYRGTEMRSRLEAAAAAWLDTHKLEWVYEPIAFAGLGGQYLPDFRVGQPATYIEVKPWFDDFKESQQMWDRSLAKMHVIHESEPDAPLVVLTSKDYDKFFLAAICEPAAQWCKPCWDSATVVA